MKITTNHISGLVVIEPKIFEDPRGYFYESYNQKSFEAVSITTTLYKTINLNLTEAF